MKRLCATLVGVLVCLPAPAWAQNRSTDAYTRYELLAPETASFRIVYDVTAVSPGAKFFFNPIRKGSEASDESVIDLMTGQPLKFEEVTGQQARDAGLTRADLETHYIQVTLARPVPEGGGQGRIRILKTYKDAKSYYRDGDLIVFDRPLGIKRNAVVLPAGYELVSCNIPVQVIEEPDGRVNVSFMNTYPGEAPLVVKARALKGAPAAAAAAPDRASAAPPPAPAESAPRVRPMDQIRVTERAFQDRDIVYFLKDPSTHAFSLYHDYTESRPGEDKYVNVVRTGSTVSDPSATVLDTGEKLKTEIMTGAQIAAQGIHIDEQVSPDTEVVIIPFAPVKKGQSIRLRISETYTDAARYALVDGQLMWHRSFGRARNAIVLPAGWHLTTTSIPAVVSQDPDGRTRLVYWNPRPDQIDIFLKARHR
ncbi:MAG TPA: hypothetical protein VFX12_06200 [Vicinamibacterales bacterium]|nr:hypothetical protein [Vicinamibacterales bacterium]